MGLSHLPAKPLLSRIASFVSPDQSDHSSAVHGDIQTPAPAVDPAQADRRHLTRIKCNWPAQCLLDDGTAIQTTIVDVSDGGLGLIGPLTIARGDRIQIDIRSIGTFNCEVAWTAAGRAGVRILSDEHDLSAEAQQALSESLMHLATS